MFEEAISGVETNEEERKRKPVEPSKEIETRLNLLTKMYASNKDKYVEENEEEKPKTNDEIDEED